MLEKNNLILIKLLMYLILVKLSINLHPFTNIVAFTTLKPLLFLKAW